MLTSERVKTSLIPDRRSIFLLIKRINEITIVVRLSLILEYKITNISESKVIVNSRVINILRQAVQYIAI